MRMRLSFLKIICILARTMTLHTDDETMLHITGRLGIKQTKSGCD